MRHEVEHRSKVPGLKHVVTSYGANRYLRIVHAPSGLVVYNWNSKPIHRVRDLMQLADKMLAVHRWDVPADRLQHDGLELATVRKLAACVRTERTPGRAHYQGRYEIVPECKRTRCRKGKRS